MGRAKNNKKVVERAQILVLHGERVINIPAHAKECDAYRNVFCLCKRKQILCIIKENHVADVWRIIFLKLLQHKVELTQV